MIKIKFLNAEKLSEAISLIKEDLGIDAVTRCPSLTVEIKECEGYALKVSLKEKQATITYGGGTAVFLRALATLTNWVREGVSEKSTEETPIFTLNGAMVDMSRNAVMNVKTVKLMMRKMALMGLNAFMLYTEDTYEIEGEPYFGYMRGRYTKDEIKELDAYAIKLGIELIPCVQFLGHLSTHLRWGAASKYRDTQNVMLVDSDDTYALIDKMLKTISECFTTRKIHIGMDETFDLGLGTYLKKHGFTSQRELYLRHLKRVVDMSRGYGLSPMLWSDMLVHLADETLENPGVYDVRTKFTDEYKALLPEGIQAVFWDYYVEDESYYLTNIDNHQKYISENTMFAGGIWTWSGFAPLFKRSLKFTIPALNACKKRSVREVIATIWHNGAESNLLAAIAGLSWYADYGYKGYHDLESAKECFKAAMLEEYDDFAALEMIEEPHGKLTSLVRSILYNDPMVPLLDKSLENIELEEYYKKTSELLSKIEVSDYFKPIFDVAVRMSYLFEKKGDFGLRLKAAYDKGELETIRALILECDEIIEKTKAVRLAHLNAWMKYNKPFGWEVFDIRYGGVISRFETTKLRLGAYLDGEVESLPELEEERLRIDCKCDDSDPFLNHILWRSHQTLATASRL